MGRGGPVKQPVRSRKLGLATLLALVVVVLTGTIAARATTGKSQPGMCASIDRLGLEKQMNVHAAQILAACGRVPASRGAPRRNFPRCSADSPPMLRGSGRQRDHGWRGHLPARDSVRDTDLGPGQHRRHDLQRLAHRAQLLLGRLVLDRQRSHVHEPRTPGRSARVTAPASATRSWSTTSRTRSGSRSSWPPVAVARASASGRRPTESRGLPGHAPTTVAATTASPGWMDNNPSSPHFGRMYVSWNNFVVGQGAIQVIHSDDGGATWSAPVNVNATFIRERADHGRPGRNGLHRRHGRDGRRSRKPPEHHLPLLRRRRDLELGHNGCCVPRPRPVPVRDYFAAMFPSYWRHMGWGDVACRTERDHPLRLRTARHRL